jgi:hypothetical protein
MAESESQSVSVVIGKTTPTARCRNDIAVLSNQACYTPRVAQAVTTNAASAISSGQPSHQVNGG